VIFLIWWCCSTPSEGWGQGRNSTKTQQSGHTPTSGPEGKIEEANAKDGAPERLRCGTIQKEAEIDPADDVRRR